MAEFTKIFTNNSQFKLILTYSHSQNITNNTTTVNATLKVQSMAYGVASGWTTKNAGISINGNNVAYTFNPNMGANSTKTIATRSYTFSHNADGTKSVNISANANYTGVTWNGGALGNVTLGGTVGLPTIPRASSIASISGGTLGSALTVNITRASSSFTHKVGYYRTNGSRDMEIISNVGTSTTFTLPLSDASLLPSATTGTAKIIVDTYSGTTRIGSASKTFTVKVPDSVVPSVTFFNLNENIEATKAIGLAANTFVKNKSQIAMTAGADGSYGSTIKDYTFSFNGASQGGTVGRQFNVGNITGNHTAKVVVKDSRGRTAERTATAVILDYNPPKINGFSTWRDGTGVVKANVNCSISVLGGKGGAWYVDSGGASWTNRNSGSLTSTAPSYNSNITIVGTYPDSSSATFRLRVDDAFGAGPIANANVSTSKTALSLYKDVGIGVGKRWEKGTLDVGGDSYFSGNIFMSPTKTIQGGGGFWNGYLPPGDMRESSYWHQTVFPKGYSLWGKTPNTGQIGNPNDDNGYALVTVFKDNYAASEFTVMYYNQPNGRVFRLGGNYSNSRLTFYELYSQASPSINVGTIYEAGKRVHADWTPPELWSGAIYMGENQSVTPSKSLANCRNGWMVVWSDYTNGVANNYDWVFTPIPKSAISAGVNGMHAIVANSNAHNAPMLSKYIYVGTGTSIIGSKNNTLAGPDNIVLRKVYEW